MFRRHALHVVLLLLAVTGLAVGCSSDDSADGTAVGSAVSQADTSTTTAAGPAKVSSEVLGQYAPPEAPGYTMNLYRVRVPPGVEIPSHHHPGQQMSRIEAGTLTYTVEQGTIEIGRGSSTPTETVDGPATVELVAGDSVFEPETDIHHAANLGDTDVVIVITSLITTGEPLSIPTS
jgi:quercetin dioxygenase-like cupin family protein